MHHMKTSTVRELRYSFSRIAKWLKAGESIEVTYRGKKLARLVPAARPAAITSESPNFEARLKILFPQGSKGKAASEIILEDRGRM